MVAEEMVTIGPVMSALTDGSFLSLCTCPAPPWSELWPSIASCNRCKVHSLLAARSRFVRCGGYSPTSSMLGTPHKMILCARARRAVAARRRAALLGQQRRGTALAEYLSGQSHNWSLSERQTQLVLRSVVSRPSSRGMETGQLPGKTQQHSANDERACSNLSKLLRDNP